MDLKRELLMWTGAATAVAGVVLLGTALAERRQQSARHDAFFQTPPAYAAAPSPARPRSAYLLHRPDELARINRHIGADAYVTDGIIGDIDCDGGEDIVALVNHEEPYPGGGTVRRDRLFLFRANGAAGFSGAEYIQHGTPGGIVLRDVAGTDCPEIAVTTWKTEYRDTPWQYTAIFAWNGNDLRQIGLGRGAVAFHPIAGTPKLKPIFFDVDPRTDGIYVDVLVEQNGALTSVHPLSELIADELATFIGDPPSIQHRKLDTWRKTGAAPLAALITELASPPVNRVNHTLLRTGAYERSADLVRDLADDFDVTASTESAIADALRGMDMQLTIAQHRAMLGSPLGIGVEFLNSYVRNLSAGYAEDQHRTVQQLGRAGAYGGELTQADARARFEARREGDVPVVEGRPWPRRVEVTDGPYGRNVTEHVPVYPFPRQAEQAPPPAPGAESYRRAAEDVDRAAAVMKDAAAGAAAGVLNLFAPPKKKNQ